MVDSGPDGTSGTSVQRRDSHELAEQKIVEENEKLLENLTIAERAVLHKTLHAEGLRITA